MMYLCNEIIQPILRLVESRIFIHKMVYLLFSHYANHDLKSYCDCYLQISRTTVFVLCSWLSSGIQESSCGDRSWTKGEAVDSLEFRSRNSWRSHGPDNPGLPHLHFVASAETQPGKRCSSPSRNLDFLLEKVLRLFNNRFYSLKADSLCQNKNGSCKVKFPIHF